MKIKFATRKNKTGVLTKKTLAAGLICLIGFSARYTVHFGHDCEMLSPWVSGLKSDLSKLEEICFVTTDSRKKDSAKHDSCPICQEYERLVHILPQEFYAILFTVHLYRDFLIIDKSPQILEDEPTGPRTSRGPPSPV